MRFGHFDRARFFRADEPRELDGREMSQLVRHVQDSASAGMIYRYSTFAPERRMMSAHFPVSARTNAANSSGVIGRASMPGFAMRRATSGWASAREARSFRRRMSSREGPEQAPRPSHTVASNPGRRDYARRVISASAS